MKILLSAFEPFGGEKVNASQEALKLIVPRDGMELIKITVPTVFGLAGKTLLEAVRRERPEVVICLGQASGRAAVTPERAALNVRDAAIPDNAGYQPQDEPVVPGAPAAYFSTLPLKAMTAAARQAGFAAEISNSAGTFVCNDLMYSLLHALGREFPSVRCGFIHIPACVPSVQAPQSPVMPSKTAAAAIETMLAALLK